jgi:hypothetical protein
MKTFECTISVTGETEKIREAKCFKYINTACVSPLKWLNNVYNYNTTMDFKSESELDSFFNKIKGIDLYHSEEI